MVMFDINYPNLMTPEQRKSFLKVWKQCIPKKDIKFKNPLIYGTGREIRDDK